MNQQVVDTGYWNRSDAVSPADPPSARRGDAERHDRRVEEVRRAVEADILPRVLLSRGHHHEKAGDVAGCGTVSEAEVLRFVKLLLNQDDEDTVVTHVMGIQARGVSIDHIYLDLFQPAARHIGELWAEDLCTFVDVTLAIGTMQRLLRIFAPLFQVNGRPAEGGRQALLVPIPGDQHTFGLSMVIEFFRRAGWGVWSMHLASLEDLGDAVQKAWFSVVGFSAGSEHGLDNLTAAIRLVRQRSCNSAVGIMVGGPIFVGRPDYVARVGADAVGEDANQALVQAEGFAAAAAAGP